VRADLPHSRLLDVDDPWVDLAQALVAQAHPIHGSRREALDHHIRVSDQFDQQLLRARMLEVETEAALAGIYLHEGAAAINVLGRWDDDRPGGAVAFGPAAQRGISHPHAHTVQPRNVLDLDDLGAQSGEKPTRAGAGEHPGQVDDADPAEREGLAVLAKDRRLL